MTTTFAPARSTSPPRSKPRVCLALPGAGTALGVISGALEVLCEEVEPVAVGGTSGGGLVALALAHGFTPEQTSNIVGEMLQRKDFLDKGWPFDQSPGLFKGRRIAAMLKKTFGENTMMGQLQLPARVCAWDAWTREPVVFCSKAHPDVLVWRAARATMAIEFFFDLVRARSDNARLYGDGGLVVNVPYGLWDDRPEPTIGLRFSHQHPGFHVADLIRSGTGNTGDVKPVKSWRDMVPAVVETALSTASASWPSEKPDGNTRGGPGVGGAGGVDIGGFHEVVLESDADGMAFGLAPTEVARRRQHGRLSAQRAKLRLL